MLTYGQSHPEEKLQRNLDQNTIFFHSRECIWKFCALMTCATFFSNLIISDWNCSKKKIVRILIKGTILLVKWTTVLKWLKLLMLVFYWFGIQTCWGFKSKFYILLPKNSLFTQSVIILLGQWPGANFTGPAQIVITRDDWATIRFEHCLLK